MTHELSTVIMYHPSRRAGVDRIAGECLPLRARLVEDPEPDGVPSPLRTAKVAWGAVAEGATHHLVLQDDVHLVDGFADHVHALIERHPDAAISLGVLWVSPYNSYRVRQAAVQGHPVVRLAPWEWVPSLGLVLPAGTARELAAFLRTFPDVTRDDDEHIAVFCAERDIPVLAPVPHLLDHSTRPSVAGNDHHGIRLGVACVQERVDPGYWDGPVLERPAEHEGLGFAVELVDSRCRIRLRRSAVREAAEQPFTWPWRPWSRLVGIPEETVRAGRPEAPGALGESLAAEVWAAGFLLGALTPDNQAYTPLREVVGAEALRSWVTAGLRPADAAAAGAGEAAVAWARRALEAGRAFAPGRGRESVERMAVREAAALLRPAPEELPDVRLEIRPCGDHAGDVTAHLPRRWLAEHLSDTSGDSTLIATACERLDPRALAAVGDLITGGWKGTVETRAATVARLRTDGLPWPEVLTALDAAEHRFDTADGPLVTLPASARTPDGTPVWAGPHPDLAGWQDLYQARLLREVHGTGL
ncbi:hypothetical protein SRB5_49360 [Streptomyces sp. RB5]|uniref:Uncharacterized protein n=1 Tax=Streptomyces smaragdinus TaxID=2585196 RepID=A0A7K0CMQ5_9ACTN|nr:hypothetical protein [Streptomyces smaragdinus]MQY14760.1 hypothetical protein [Streptomyces smaragdinus]